MVRIFPWDMGGETRERCREMRGGIADGGLRMEQGRLRPKARASNTVGEPEKCGGVGDCSWSLELSVWCLKLSPAQRPRVSGRMSEFGTRLRRAEHQTPNTKRPTPNPKHEIEKLAPEALRHSHWVNRIRHGVRAPRLHATSRRGSCSGCVRAPACRPRR